ncbi:MAG: site-specific integrase [Anaerostipes sp.]|nr:site-specific integrase [Anaerostipes sp.]
MNTVQPIRDMTLVVDIADYLKNKSERNYVLFMTGVYSGLRISDILPFQVRTVRDKDHIYMREQKTGKEKRYLINKNLQKIYKEYIKDMDDYEYLFESPRGHKPITRQQAYNIIRDAGEFFGISNLGTHTMRKTFGYHMYQKTKDAAMLMNLFNHSDIHVTLRYIGVEQDTTDDAIAALNFN